MFARESNQKDVDGIGHVKVNSNGKIYKIGNAGLYLNGETDLLDLFIFFSDDKGSTVATEENYFFLDI